MGDKYVITASHCVQYFDIDDVKVRIGDTSLDEEFEATSFTVSVAQGGLLK